MTVDQLPRGRHDLTSEQVRESQRGRLLQAMADSVAERGYVATTVADVIKRARVSRKTFYEIFPDKPACFAAAYDLAVEIIMEAIGTARAEPGTWHQRLERGFVAMTDVLAANPTFAAMCILEVWGAGPEARARHLETIDGFRVFLEDIHEEVGDTVFGGIVGGVATILYREISEGRGAEIGRVVPALVDFVTIPVEAVRARRGSPEGH